LEILFDKCTKTIQWREDRYLPTQCWDIWISTHNIKWTSTHTSCNSKWITDLNVKCKTIKLLENIAENLCDLGFGDKFLNIMPKVQNMKKFAKLDFIKIKNVC
ncbi:LORF2 protein, partial [Crocuta crocuta]